LKNRTSLRHAHWPRSGAGSKDHDAARSAAHREWAASADGAFGGENIDILVDGKVIGFGEIVIIEDAMGIRVTDFQ
jgi:hypothetical protein